jgi:hypothetical protein
MKKLLTLGLALAVIGCGSGTDPAETTTTSAVTTSAQAPTTTLGGPTTTMAAPETTLGSTTTLATTTTTTSAQTTTTALTEETISPAGFWEVRIGETVSENEERIGVRFDDLGGDPDNCVVLQLPEVGGIYFIASTLTGNPVDGREDLVLGRASTESPGWMTEIGIEVGMSIFEAEASLGDTITSREPHFYVEEGEYIVVGPEDARYIFETDGEAITAIHAGLEPIVSYVEACS